MANLTADRQTNLKANPGVRSNRGDVAAATIIFFGQLIARNAAGYTVPASDAAAVKVTGISQQFIDNSLGADGALTVLYQTNVLAELDNFNGSIVQAGKHARCYVGDDHSVTSKATSLHRVLAGTVHSFTATKVWVHVDDALGADVDSEVAVNGAVSPAVLSGAAVQIIPLDIPDAATATYTYVNADKIEIVDVTVIKDTAGAGNTIQIKDGAGAAISDAIAAAVDKTVARAGTLDKAKRTLNAAAGFQITATRAAGSMAAQVYLHVIKR